MSGAAPVPRRLIRLPTIARHRLIAKAALWATLAFVVLDIVVWAGQRFMPPPVSFIQGQGVYAAEMLYAMAYAAMGYLLATRLPRNPLGWLFLAIGLGMAGQMLITFLVQEGHQAFRPIDPVLLMAAWAGSTLHLPLTVSLFVFVFTLFPDGRGLSPRWAMAGWLALLGAVLIMVSVGLDRAGLQWYPSLPNPLAGPAFAAPLLTAIGSIGLLLLVGGVVMSTTSMVVRYRRAGEIQRVQLRWVAVAVLLLAACGLPFVVARYALQMSYASGEALLAIALLAGGFLPIAAAIAVLRHRLYDIDFLINRALVYIPLSGILGGLYAAGVATFQRIFVAFTGNTSDAAIIITTLVVASLFTPARSTLQVFVDRHFKPARGTDPPELPELIPADELRDQLLRLEQRITALEGEPQPGGADRS